MGNVNREEWLTCQMLIDQIKQAEEVVAEHAGRAFREYVNHMVFSNVDDFMTVALESPLEAAFWVWWRAYVLEHGESWMNNNSELQAQREVYLDGATYRLDFAIALRGEIGEAATRAGLAWRPIAIELDGHTFHEKTREQVTYRNQRDRALQKAGWQVFHISFDEMAKNGMYAVEEVFIAVHEQLLQL